MSGGFPSASAVLGVWLLITAVWEGDKLSEEKKEIVIDDGKAKLNRRFEMIGWGLFLIMLGGFILVPHELVNGGLWSIGVGVIMLGLNAARYFNDIRMSAFTTVLGVIAVITGIAQLLGMDMLEGALFFIILGAYLLLKPWFDRQQLFGKAEEA